MQVLLDTNAFLWWVTDDSKLSNTARSIISNPKNPIFFSVVSAWEIAIESQLGKLPLPEPAKLYIPNRVEHYGFIRLSIGMKFAALLNVRKELSSNLYSIKILKLAQKAIIY